MWPFSRKNRIRNCLITLAVVWVTCSIMKNRTIMDVLLKLQGDERVIDKQGLDIVVPSNITTMEKNKHKTNKRSSQRPPFKMELDLVHAKRRQTLLDVCEGKEFDPKYRGTLKDPQIKDYFLVDRKHKFIYCTMEKIGSTFWRRLWQVIAGLSEAKNPYDILPEFALAGGQETMKNMAFDEIHTMLSAYKTFVIVRHPFYRLFSGYVDKIFSPNPLFWENISPYIISITRGQTKSTCGHNITFREFIRYFIYSETNDTRRNGHFLPMYDHCRPCQVKYDVIGKIETFLDDTLYIVKSLGLDDLYSDLNITMRNVSLKDTLVDQANLLFNYKNKVCLSFYEAQRRVWKQLQIRGAISKHSACPFSEKEAEIITRQQYIDALENAVGDAKIRKKSKQFREEAFVEAFSSIPREDLVKLIEILKPDCEIFGYDCSMETLLSKFAKYRSDAFYFNVSVT